VLALLAGCGGKKRAGVRVPVPPPPATQAQTPGQTKSPAEPESQPLPVPRNARPIWVETGLASWYGPPYHNRRASNGELYDMHRLTAAHRTLPLDSIVRVTNMKTGSSTVVRITDRGPFVEGRVIDLSMAAAKAVDVWRPGTAPVRVEVLRTPRAIEDGGRWCVQIGAIHDEEIASTLKSRLTRRFQTARVLQFSSPVGDWWIRVRVAGDDRLRAEELAAAVEPEQGLVWLVRMD